MFFKGTVASATQERGKYIHPFSSKSAKRKFIRQSCPFRHQRAQKGGCMGHHAYALAPACSILSIVYSNLQRRGWSSQRWDYD